jgi:cell division protein FtsB
LPQGRGAPFRVNTGLAWNAWLSENHLMRSRNASPIQTLLRRAGLPALVLIAVGFFAYNAVLGPTGVMATKQIKADYDQKSAEYAALDKKRAALKNRVELLDQKRGVDPDLADELARKQLNVVRPDEVVIPLDKHAPSPTGR